jgi:hypothetical protein
MFCSCVGLDGWLTCVLKRRALGYSKNSLGRGGEGGFLESGLYCYDFIFSTDELEIEVIPN